jgi:hypothetical protein
MSAFETEDFDAGHTPWYYETNTCKYRRDGDKNTKHKNIQHLGFASHHPPQLQALITFYACLLRLRRSGFGSLGGRKTAASFRYPVDVGAARSTVCRGLMELHADSTVPTQRTDLYTKSKRSTISRSLYIHAVRDSEMTSPRSSQGHTTQPNRHRFKFPASGSELGTLRQPLHNAVMQSPVSA